MSDDTMEPETSPRPGRAGRVLGWMRRNGYLVVVGAALLVLTRAIEFEPPPQVRVGKPNVAQLVGDAPEQEFSYELANPQAVQLRATLRLYPENELPVGMPDPDMDRQGKLLSQPVITTILGLNATFEQAVRLDDGDLDLDIELHATPRSDGKFVAGKPPPPVSLEFDLHVTSRRSLWWRGRPIERVHLDTRAILEQLDENGHRVVFAVDEHLFSLDLELHRPLGTVAGNTLAKTNDAG